MYKNRNKLVLKLEVTSSAGWRKEANYILHTKHINNIVSNPYTYWLSHCGDFPFFAYYQKQPQH